MDIKKELGKKIQLLRQDRGLSRQAICQDEAILTTRQLQRIEKGEHIPNALTAKYLAAQLGVTVDELLDETVHFLPQAYLELKYQLFRLAHFGHPQKLQQREALLETIYDTYFDQLPEAEQVSIQLFQAGLDMITTGNVAFDQGLLEEYFLQLFTKHRLTVNDLLVMKLYFIKMGLLQQLDVPTMEALASLVKQARAYTPVEDLFLVQENLLNVVNFYFMQGNYQEVASLLVMVEELMQKRYDFQHKPAVLMFYWKLALHEEKNLAKAEKFYHDAILLCEMTHQEMFRQRMAIEWEQEIKKWHK